MQRVKNLPQTRNSKARIQAQMKGLCPYVLVHEVILPLTILEVLGILLEQWGQILKNRVEF